MGSSTVEWLGHSGIFFFLSSFSFFTDQHQNALESSGGIFVANPHPPLPIRSPNEHKGFSEHTPSL
jgi:hypothetical protein